MRFSVEWLKKWVKVDIDARQLAEELTAAGLEVDSVKPVAAPFSGVVIGEILSCDPHPDADKLKLCQVDAGDGETLQVVCGAPNARAGMKIPFAKIGATLGGEFKIKKAKLRGAESFGMACSARELGLSDDHSGLLELPADAPLGADFREYLRLDDYSINLELTPNRGDCLGIRGLARDVAAICGSEYTPLEVKPVTPTIDDRIDIELVDAEDCPLYVGRIIRGIDPAARSPLWMREALRRSGIRSISVVVDATNYVLMELGQPLHAFDLDMLDGGITVRRGKPGETLVLLDEREVELDEKLLAICDVSGPLALAGIMGGLASGVSEATRNILLESAWFKPPTISERARALGLHTDASHRFERGVDPRGQVEAMERITALLLEIAGGEAGPVIVAEAPEQLPDRKPVRLRLARLNHVLGSDLKAEEVDRILNSLGMSTSEADGGWEVLAPSRRFDIEIEEDLIEEVARIHGYNCLPATLPSGELHLRTISEQRVALTQIQEALCAGGYQEAINYSFVDRGLLQDLHMDQDVLPLANPISSDMDVMRTSLLPGLLKSLQRNLRRQQDRVRLFETGVVFRQRTDLQELNQLCAIAYGSALPEQWGAKQRDTDFYDMKKDVERLLELQGLRVEYEFNQLEKPWLHPGQSAGIKMGGEFSGWLGMIHPSMTREMGIKKNVFAFEMNLTKLSKREIPYAKNISQYPSVRRDLALLVPEHTNYSEIKTLVIEMAGDLLVNLVVFDQFSGQNVEKGYKSLAIGLILQDVSCTLTDEVVDSLIQDIVKGLESRLDAQLRG